MAGWLKEANEALIPIICDPWKIHHYGKSLGTRNHTDAVDARVIALYATERKPKARPQAPPRL